MGGRVGRIDEEVIHVDDEPSFCDHVMEGIIHEALEGSRGISQTKKHHGWFKESFVDDKSSFPLMSVFDSDIVVFPADVKLGEHFHSLKFINEVGNKWKGVHIMNGVFVNIAVVLARAKATVFLLDKEERGCLWGAGEMDFASS